MANQQPGVSQQQRKISADSLFYEFSPEEKKVMQECNRDSFYERSLPLSLTFGAGTYMVINAGFLKRSLKWGPWPKVIGAGLLGYVIGKYSYQNKCAERLMQIPNSEIGRVLRERRGKAMGENSQGNILTPTIIPGVQDTDVSSFETDYKSDIDIDMHKPMNSLDTDYRPNYDGLSSTKNNEYPMSSYNSPITYDILRARNRQDFEKTQPSHYLQ
ncbi:OCIA domain-containing protein 1 isoform X2 [Sipha flava]|uniref:OCIA domain-containing protein 1 isoform X2 n=1 Tax=Sipha flava TaxID=143950 RepID=A0A8B8G7G7_9HEMI|nr:OCIA domain-containing protein 1 isoform X2 [Sipha flava]